LHAAIISWSSIGVKLFGMHPVDIKVNSITFFFNILYLNKHPLLTVNLTTFTSIKLLAIDYKTIFLVATCYDKHILMFMKILFHYVQISNRVKNGIAVFKIYFA